MQTVSDFVIDPFSEYSNVVQLLLERGAGIDMCDETGRQPLHYAAMCGFVPCLAMLLNYKAEPNVSDSEGYTPLFYSVANV